MPAIPLNRSNAWEFWKTGRVAATNVDNIGVDAPGTTPILANLAVKHGFNAIRYWLNWGIATNREYTLLPEDWQRIAWEGWTSTAVTKRTQGTADPVTIAMVAAQVQKVLKKCEALGLGVILTGDFLSGAGGRLWADKDSSEDGWGSTTAAGLQGDLGLFWQKTVSYFGASPALIGIDLLNEPQPTAGLTLSESRSATRTDTWPRLAQYLIAVIRQVDSSAASNSTTAPRIPLIAQGALEGGLGLNQFLNPANVNDNSFLLRDYTYGSGNAANPARADDRIVYSSHAYMPGDIAGQGVFDATGLAMGTQYPITTLARAWLNTNGTPLTAVELNFTTDAGWDALFSAERTLVNKLGQPVFLGEFGSVQPKLEYIHPASTTRASKQQRVTEVTALSNGMDGKAIADYRQVTSVTFNTGLNSYTLGLDNIADATFQPVNFLDANQVTTDKTFPTDNFTINARGCPVDANGVEVPVSGWRPNWFANPNLSATLYWTDANGKVVMTPVFLNKAVKVVGGVKSITVSGRLTGTLPGKVRGTADAQGKYPVVGVLSFDTFRSDLQIDQSRADMAKAMLRMCQRNKLSWAYFCEDVDAAGFVGWRPSPAIHALLTKAARGDAL